ncbi:SMC domain protein [mine drainage metagenome]|uniref:SMC domain protein n=1 Tax=mine drainage metagenome TaxID=410659 RepID=T0ZS85_9ZZZZ
MIKSIELINWKTHKNTVIDFQRGVNVIVGIMGAGKSSVMDAISYALFGTFPALAHKRVSLGNMIMNRPSEESHAEIRLTFDADGDNYNVVRKISAKQGSEARIEKNGSYLQAQSERVTETVEELLRLDYDTFSRAVYSEQNGLEYFLDLSKSERKRSIDEMLGLDHFSAAEENATSYINSVRSLIEGEENALAQIDIKQFKDQMDALLNERVDVAKRRDDLSKKAGELGKTAKDMKTKLDALKGEMEKKRNLMEKRTTISARNAALNGEIKKIDALGIAKEEVEKRLKEAKDNADSMAKALEALRKEESDAVRSASSLEANIKTLKKKASDKKAIEDAIRGMDESKLKMEIERCNEDLEKFRNGIAEKRTGIAEGKRWLSELSKHLSKCPLCERELSPDMRQSLLESKEAAVKALETELSGMLSDAKILDGKAKAAKDAMDRLALERSRLKDFMSVDSDLAKLSEELDAASAKRLDAENRYKKKVEDNNRAVEALNSAKLDMDKVRRKEDYAKEVKANSIDLKGIDERLSKMDVDDKAIYSMQDSLTKVSSELSEVNSKVGSDEAYINKLDAQISEKRKQLEDFGRIETRIKARRSLLANLNKFKMALIDTEAMLRSKLISSVNSLMQSVWSELYPYGDYTAIRLTAKKDDYLLEARVDMNGDEIWLGIDSVASGGERSLSCLAMRIAMSMVIVPNLRWIILDEPTHNVDSNGIDRLIDMLGNSLPKVVDQVFIITHDESMKQISGAKVYMLDRDKDVHGNTVASVI